MANIPDKPLDPGAACSEILDVLERARKFDELVLPDQVDALFHELVRRFGCDTLARSKNASQPSQVALSEILSRAAATAKQRIRQAAEIEQERNRARSIFGAIVSAIVVVDFDGRIIESNVGANAVFDRDITGRMYADVFGFDRHDPIRACLDRREPQHRIEAIGVVDGIRRVWGVTVSPLESPAVHLGPVGASGQRGVSSQDDPVHDDPIRGAVVGFRDLTALKKMEQALAATERQAMVGRMAATVAHEVNNPLGAIKAHLRLLKRELADDDASKRLDVVSDQVDRIARTIQVLLGFSRRRSAADDSVALSEIIRAVLDLFEGGFREKGIQVRTVLPDNLPAIRADADQIQEVMINILENARDALAKGSQLIITADIRSNELECPAPWPESAAPWMEIRIEDDGPGLGEDPEKIFEPFYTTKTTGTGLGLTIARRICEAHGGRLLAENRSPAGAAFRILMPVNRSPADHV